MLICKLNVLICNKRAIHSCMHRLCTPLLCVSTRPCRARRRRGDCETTSSLTTRAPRGQVHAPRALVSPPPVFMRRTGSETTGCVCRRLRTKADVLCGNARRIYIRRAAGRRLADRFVYGTAAVENRCDHRTLLLLPPVLSVPYGRRRRRRRR